MIHKIKDWLIRQNKAKQFEIARIYALRLKDNRMISLGEKYDTLDDGTVIVESFDTDLIHIYLTPLEYDYRKTIKREINELLLEPIHEDIQ